MHGIGGEERQEVEVAAVGIKARVCYSYCADLNVLALVWYAMISRNKIYVCVYVLYVLSGS